jgi:hypothetical protein
MNRVFCTIALTFGVVALVGLQTAKAGFATKDSSDFSWKYEMDVLPSAQNLDGNLDGESNPIMDFHGHGTDEVPPAITVLDGIMSMDVSSQNYRLDSNATGEIWPVKMTYAAGFTIETKVKILTSTGTHGAMMMDPCAAGGSGDFFSFGAGETSWGYSGSKQILSSADNSDDYHVFRLAQLPNENSFSMWRDNQLIGSGLTGGFAFGDNLEFGSGGSQWRGTANIDYLRFTSGVWAPVPEPAALTLLVTELIGLLAYAWRKRK